MWWAHRAACAPAEPGCALTLDLSPLVAATWGAQGCTAPSRQGGAGRRLRQPWPGCEWRWGCSAPLQDGTKCVCVCAPFACIASSWVCPGTLCHTLSRRLTWRPTVMAWLQGRGWHGRGSLAARLRAEQLPKPGANSWPSQVPTQCSIHCPCQPHLWAGIGCRGGRRRGRPAAAPSQTAGARRRRPGAARP